MNILITGVSGGLGKSLMEEYLNAGHTVFGMSRSPVNQCAHVSCDLGKLEEIPGKLEKLLEHYPVIDLVILNAGMLGEIKLFKDWTSFDLAEIMNINVWSNKVIIDWILAKKIVRQVVSISSGASEHTYKGWSGYSLSKSALKMMMDVYSKEQEGVHFMSVAPGLVNTSMQDYLCNKVDRIEFPIIDKFISARENGLALSPEMASQKLIEIIPQLIQFESGSFVDMRKI
jgi:benzil reductase ((S)-benzoin forming)